MVRLLLAGLILTLGCQRSAQEPQQSAAQGAPLADQLAALKNEVARLDNRIGFLQAELDERLVNVELIPAAIDWYLADFKTGIIYLVKGAVEDLSGANLRISIDDFEVYYAGELKRALKSKQSR